MNEHVKPTFLAYIADLEQSDLVGLLTDLVDNDAIKERVLNAILKRNDLVVPDPNYEKITDHNIKRVQISYQSNYNGCILHVLETADGEDKDEYEDSDEFDDLQDTVTNAIVEHACAECNDDGEFCGLIDDLAVEVVRIVELILGTEVEVIFEEDNTST